MQRHGLQGARVSWHWGGGAGRKHEQVRGGTCVFSLGAAACWGSGKLSAGHGQGRAALHTCSSCATKH